MNVNAYHFKMSRSLSEVNLLNSDNDDNSEGFSTVHLDDDPKVTGETKAEDTRGGNAKKPLERKSTTKLAKLLRELPDKIKLQTIRRALKTTDFISAILAVITIWLI